MGPSGAARNVNMVNLVPTVAGLAVGVVLLLVACSSAPPSAQPTAATSQSPGASDVQATQTSEGGQVTVSATWAGPPAGAVFQVALDTHSVDLDSLDLANAVLRNDRGETLVAQPWPAPAGGHHRAGALSFDGDSPSFFASARWIELVLVGIGDLPERVLRWLIVG